MKTEPHVTIITPFLNVGSYLAEAVESVLAQTYDDWELLLVDDGSTDEGGAVAEAYAERHPDRIRVLRHPGGANRGISASRNLGRGHARARWLANLDGDDVWLPHALATLVDVTRRHPEVGIVMGATRYWRSWRPEMGPEDDQLIEVGAHKHVVIPPPRLLDQLYPLGPGDAPSMNTVLVRTDVVDEVGGWEDSFRTSFEDQAFLVKVYMRTPAFITSECLDLYRQRPGSTMQSELVETAGGFPQHHRRFLEWLEAYLTETGHDRPETWAKLERALRPYRRPKLERAIGLGRRALGRLPRLVGRHT